MKRELTNQRDQPVELHLAGGVVVLGPRQSIELDDETAASPQVVVLERRRHVTVKRRDDEPTPAPAAVAETKSDMRKKATRGA
jgi:hypothetical protein